MNTPIIDFVRQYKKQKNLRLHMPGHKGKPQLGFEEWDITEIDGADVLYSAKGIIKQSEANATALFGTRNTFFSTEGSSLSIRAMLCLNKIYAGTLGKKPLIFAGRNAHKTFVTAAALLDFDVKWLLPEYGESIISCNITGDMLDLALKNAEEKPFAVYVTSPDYLGNMLNIADLSAVCRKHGVLLLVDNAHGAYLKFLPQTLHPIDLGADICCDSAHKTLPVLTGGGYLHISKSAPSLFSEQAENAMALFASTSPSYLILQALDMANKYLYDGYRERLAEFLNKTEALKQKLKESGFTLCGNEPLKLTIATKSYGYTGNAFAKILIEKGIVCEFSDSDYIVFMLTPETGDDGLRKLEEELFGILRKPEILEHPPIFSSRKRVLGLKEAIFAPSREMEISLCRGKILSAATVNCPPAIPIVICGEEIDANAIECFKYYGIKDCFVVDD